MRNRSLALLVAVAVVLGGACASTPAGNSYRTIGAVKIAVDTGMQVWADRVIDGKTTPAQEAQVKKAFTEYAATARAAAAVMRSTSDSAPPDLAAAANALLALLASFGINAGVH
jgi:hypothetical protein